MSCLPAESSAGAAGDSADVFGRSSVSGFSFAALAAQSETRGVSSFSTNGEISKIAMELHCAFLVYQHVAVILPQVHVSLQFVSL